MAYLVHKHTEAEIDAMYKGYIENYPRMLAESRNKERRLRAQNKRGAPYTSEENRNERLEQELMDSITVKGARRKNIKYTREEYGKMIKANEALMESKNYFPHAPCDGTLYRGKQIGA